MSRCDRTLGPDHPFTLRTAGSLAMGFHALDRSEQASHLVSSLRLQDVDDAIHQADFHWDSGLALNALSPHYGDRITLN
ncbi:hypothetical protein J4573_39505 [Actinomadura barringtoniae]|uniref:Tetratricopeptide repeat protein n=1 Tax=Actinomadura barringtoniae TaxID=1427535 RepID=A0A939PIB1_9ACTN|nr:hypothetical protein [Actinomadura barringtoniae]MBO2453236.1 hypothetical protein [Actinomadura barringtoniae]